MADVPKLADSFNALKLTIGVDPRFLGTAIELCVDMGLHPDIHGFKNKRVLFSVLVPYFSGEEEKVQKVFLGAVKSIGGVLFASATERLVCPLNINKDKEP